MHACVVVATVVSDSVIPRTVYGILQVRVLGWLPCPPPGDLPNPGTKPTFPVGSVLQVDSLPLSHWGGPNTS